nr:DUF4839 domain-containing protein [Actinomyces sp.]
MEGSTDPDDILTATEAQAASEPPRLTPENNPDLSALLQVGEPGDPSVASFAKAYAGQEIEFDASFCYVVPHGDATTRFDVLVCPGDFDPDHASGPAFKLEDVNPQADLNLPSITYGSNIHLIARVGEYKPLSELFLLDPIEARLR